MNIDKSAAASALQRLQASRERLAGELAARAPAGTPSGSRGAADWLGSHPLLAAAGLARHAGDELLRPTAAEHPFLLVGGAFGLGAVLAWCRPWRALRDARLLELVARTALASATARGAASSYSRSRPAPMARAAADS